MPDPDPFAALAALRRTAAKTLTGQGLQLQRMVAEAGEAGGPRLVQMIVTALPDWEPATVDEEFDRLIEGAHQAGLDDLRERLKEGGGFL